jgi:hypothetical protein
MVNLPKYIFYIFLFLCFPSFAIGTDGTISIVSIKAYDGSGKIIEEINYDPDYMEFRPGTSKIVVSTSYYADINTDNIPAKGYYPNNSEFKPSS